MGISLKDEILNFEQCNLDGDSKNFKIYIVFCGEIFNANFLICRFKRKFISPTELLRAFTDMMKLNNPFS